MGLFVQRPEENEDWAGLPSEPLRSESTAERLTDAARIDAASLDAIFGAGSIVIPIATEPHADDAGGSEPTR